MTVDALERFAGGKEQPFPAEMPAWVPAVIAREARHLATDFRIPDEGRAATVRLTVDPRMLEVWSHLTRRRRADGRFLQPTRFNLSWTADPAKRQDFAILMLFEMVNSFAAYRPRVLLQRDLHKIQEEREAMARRLWAEAETLGYLEEIGELPLGRAKILGEAGAVLWHMTTEAPLGDTVVERDRGEREAHAMAVAVARACCWLFGTPLYSLTATMTAVALDRDVSRGQVRQWWASRPSEWGADKGSSFGRLSAYCKPQI